MDMMSLCLELFSLVEQKQSTPFATLYGRLWFIEHLLVYWTLIKKNFTQSPFDRIFSDAFLLILSLLYN